jgi:glycosyltransferase involved in cell wall biosynthesis
MKKILCDIDLIIDGILDEKNQAGIFQTNKSILLEFLKNKKLDVYFCANRYSASLIADKSQDKKWNFINEKKVVCLQSFKQKNLNYLEIVKKNLLAQNKKTLRIKAVRFFVSMVTKSIQFFLPDINFLNKKKIENFDIYFSFYYPIPDFINSNKSITKAIFLHDLTPINNPQFHTKIIKKEFAKILKSIKNDTLIFVNSECTKNDFLKHYPKFKNNKIIVALLAADKKKFYIFKNKAEKILQKYEIPTNEKYFLSLGSLNPRKNLEFIVESFEKFLRQNPKASINLVLAGAIGWKSDELLKKANKKRIFITGFIEDNDLKVIYNGALAFVYPSLYEGFGLPVLEAMQCGLPIITSNTTSLPEVAGDAGILIDPTNKEELVKAFEKLYINKELRKNLIKKSLSRIKKFSWEKTAKKIISAF